MINPELNEIEKSGVVNTFVITAGHGDHIERCLRTLVETEGRVAHRTIFVECPSEKERPILYDRVKDYVDVYIRTEKNYGFLKSVNMGVRLAFTPYITVVHDDCWFEEALWWEKAARELEQDKELMMVQPIQKHRREQAGARGSLSEIYCMIFKKEWFDIVGYFDERIYPVGPEDLEIWRQAAAHDIHVGVTDVSSVCHKGVGRESDSTGGPRMDYANHNYDDWAIKWGGKKGDAMGGLSHGNKVLPIYKSLIKQL